MGIQKDAEELLVFCYKKYTTKHNLEKEPQFNELKFNTKWEDEKMHMALKYLLDKKLIIRKYYPELHFLITTKGIDIIENASKFKRNFGHEVNLGFYKFSWGASEK